VLKNVRKLIRIREVMEMTGLGRSSIYNRLGESKYADPSFPKPISLSSSPDCRGAVAWELHEVQAYIEAKMAAR